MLEKAKVCLQSLLDMDKEYDGADRIGLSFLSKGVGESCWKEGTSRIGAF